MEALIVPLWLGWWILLLGLDSMVSGGYNERPCGGSNV